MAYDRLRKRGRKEEAGVPMLFIEVGLTLKHEFFEPIVNIMLQTLTFSCDRGFISHMRTGLYTSLRSLERQKT